MVTHNPAEDGSTPLTPGDLQQFTGTCSYYAHWLRPLVYTDGVQYFAERAGAYWFLDIVATEIMEVHRREPFVSICMKVENDRAVITADDGNENLLWSRAIEWTDCPAGEWRFYLCDNVLMVPSEY